MRRTIILDSAHGAEVAGKRSPDGKHREYKWSRERLTAIAAGLKKNGVNVEWSHIGDNEPGLSNRVAAMNKIAGPAFVFSLHNNAAGSGSVWMNASGNEIWTCKGQTSSDPFATMIFNGLKAGLPNLTYRSDIRDGDPDKEENFTVLMSVHPSALLEWQFQDNKQDVATLSDPVINRKLEVILIEVLTQIARG